MHVQELGGDDAESFLLFRAQGLAADHDAFRVTREDDAVFAIDAWRSRLIRDHVVTVKGRGGEWLGVGGLSQFARERGSKGGRRPVVTPDKLRKVRMHIAAGLTVREAAARLKIGKTALYKASKAKLA